MKVDGERKAWDLYRCVSERWPDPRHPVRKNLELTISLRNKIEHRYEEGPVAASAGFCQALVLNYEAELTEKFGSGMSVAHLVHLPVSLSTFNEAGVKSLVAAQQSLPKKLKDFFIDFRSGLSDDVLSDRRFEFRVELVQKRAPSGSSDLAISLVRESDLSVEERQAYKALEKTGRVIIRDKFRPVTNLGRFRPSECVGMWKQQFPSSSTLLPSSRRHGRNSISGRPALPEATRRRLQTSGTAPMTKCIATPHSRQSRHPGHRWRATATRLPCDGC